MRPMKGKPKTKTVMVSRGDPKAAEIRPTKKKSAKNATKVSRDDLKAAEVRPTRKKSVKNATKDDREVAVIPPKTGEPKPKARKVSPDGAPAPKKGKTKTKAVGVPQQPSEAALLKRMHKSVETVSQLNEDMALFQILEATVRAKGDARGGFHAPCKPSRPQLRTSPPILSPVSPAGGCQGTENAGGHRGYPRRCLARGSLPLDIFLH